MSHIHAVPADPVAPLLSLIHIGKTYVEPVLTGVSLHICAGQVLALTGENGAGKSTLSKIVCGLESATTGGMLLDGLPYAPASRADAERCGIRMVMQELNLIPTLSVAENLFLKQLPHRFGWIDRARLERDARAQMAKVGLDQIDPWTLVGALGIGHQQMIEIARNLIGDCRLLVLDEPTAMLTHREVELLFAQIARLTAQGVAIVYISHRLEELKRVADRIAVLRDGALVCDDAIGGYESADLVRLMVGRAADAAIDLGGRASGAPALKVRDLRRAGAVLPVSFDLAAGEILGIAGLIGSGRTELLRLIFGADHADGGQVYVGGAAEPARIKFIRLCSQLIGYGSRKRGWYPSVAAVALTAGPTSQFVAGSPLRTSMLVAGHAKSTGRAGHPLAPARRQAVSAPITKRPAHVSEPAFCTVTEND